MSSKKEVNNLISFSLRLTCWYALFFLLALTVVFMISCQVLFFDFLHITDRQLLAQTNRIESESSQEGVDQASADIRESIEEEGKNRIFYRLLSSDMHILATSDPLRWPCLNFPVMGQWAKEAVGPTAIYHTLKPPDRDFKIRLISRSIAGGRYIVQIGKTMRDEEELMQVYRKVFLEAGLGLFLCGIFLAWLEAQKAMNRIAHLMRELKDVTDNIAHDLRTPITRIRGLAETTMYKKQDINKYQELIGDIIEECDRLGQMINIMLEIAQAEAGLRKIEKSSVDIKALVTKGYEIFEPVAHDRGIKLHLKSTSGPIMVKAEAVLLQRIISNLLDNAIKFTPSGGEVLVEIQKLTSQVIISIKDTGIGVAPDQQQRIFEKFYRVESSRSMPGNGLGLSYVKSMTMAMGGKVNLESALGQGSRFILVFPLQI